MSESDADALVRHREDADLFDAAIGENRALAKRVANLMLGLGRKIANERNRPLAEMLPEAEAWRQLAELLEAGTINATAAEKLLGEVLRDRDPAEGIDFATRAAERHLIQVRDEGRSEEHTSELQSH